MTVDQPPPRDASVLKTNRAFAFSTVVTLSVIVLVVPFAVLGSYRGLQAMNNHTLSWMPSDTPSRARYQQFVSHFEHYDPVVVSWPGCTIDDDRVDEFAEALRAAGTGDGSNGNLFHRVVTGRDLLRELTARPLRLSRQAAITRLLGSMIGPDRESTCAVVVLTPEAARVGGEALQVIYDVAQQECGLERNELRLGGSAVESAEIDVASVRSLVDNILPSAIAVVLVAWPFLRSFWVTVLVCVGALSIEATMLALVYYSGAEVNGILVVMPSLIFVLFVAGAVHLLNYYDDAVVEVGPVAAPLEAVRVGWLPCLLATLTTAVGTASLAASGIKPVVVFAEYATIGIVSALAMLFLLLPGAMVFRSRWQGGGSARRSWYARRPDRWPTWHALARIIAARHLIVVGGFLAVMIWGAAGLSRLRATMELGDFFTEETKIVQDHEWLEDTIGPLLPVEVVLRFGQQAPANMRDRLLLVRRIEEAIEETGAAGASLSAATLLPSPELGSDARAIAQRVVLDRRLRRQVDDLVRSNYLAREGDDQLWRISTRIYALSPSDYGQSLDAVESAVQTVLDEQQEQSRDVSAIYTGMLPLIVEFRSRLLLDLATSFALALVVIVVVLAIAFRNVGLGLLSLLPNVFPTLLVFGALGWMGSHIDIGSMMTASVGLGIAIDDTVHYLTWYRRGIALGQAPSEAIWLAYRRCGGAMIRTTVICSAGLIVFVLSPLVPAAQFSLMICVLLAMSLAGDLLFLPALLCALGRRKVRDASAEPGSNRQRAEAPKLP